MTPITREQKDRYNQRRREKRLREKEGKQTVGLFYDDAGTLSHRLCIDCARKKPIHEYKTPNRRKCNECVNGMHLKRRYGLTYDCKRLMYLQQEGKCGICTRSIAFESSYIDHNHSTGKVRGLLCPNCNTQLGMLGDGVDPVRLLAPFLYIRAGLPEKDKAVATAAVLAKLLEI